MSIDIGITPAAAEVPGATEHAIPVKPIDRCEAAAAAAAAFNTARILPAPCEACLQGLVQAPYICVRVCTCMYTVPYTAARS